jgi:hypothetical protein
MTIFSKCYSLPTTLQIVSDICLVDPDDHVMLAALLAKLHHTNSRHIVYFRTSPQEEMDDDEYWKTIIDWTWSFCKSVGIPWNVNTDGDLVFGNSIIKLIDGNTHQYVHAGTRAMTHVPSDINIVVDATLLCGREGPSSIKTIRQIIYVGDLNLDDPLRPKTLRINSSEIADANMAELRRAGGKVTNLRSSVSRVTPSLGNYSSIFKDLGAKQCLIFLFSRGPPFFECNKDLMQRCFPGALYREERRLNELVETLDEHTQDLITNWTGHVNNDDFTYLIKLACVLVGDWPYKQTDVQDPSFGWNLCWSPADPNGLSKTLKEEYIMDPKIMVDNLNRKASELFGPGNALSPTYYDLYGLFLAMGTPLDSDTFQQLSIEFADFTRSEENGSVKKKRREEKTNECTFILKVSAAIIAVAYIYTNFF